MSNIVYDSGQGDLENWLIKEASFEQNYLNKYESIFAQGNGYLGLRQALEESYVNDHRNLFISGVYDQVEGEVPELVNLPDITFMDIYIDGQLFSLLQGEINHYSRTLNLKNGEVIRSFDWLSPTKKSVNFTFKRFVSNSNQHLIVQSLELKANSDHVAVRLESGINSQVTNRGVQHIKYLDQQIDNQGILVNKFKTSSSDVNLSYRMLQQGYKNQQLIEGDNYIRNKQMKQFFDCQLAEDDVLYFEKKTVIYGSRDVGFVKLDIQEQLADEAIATLAQLSYQELLEASSQVWELFWLKNDIKIQGENDFEQLSIRFSLYHLMIMTNKMDSRVGIGAKGLTGEEYKGHSFWDTEIFIMPFYTYTNPTIARQLLNYRYGLLPKAKEKALEFGYLGAMYPWEAAWDTDGEVTERFIGIDRETGKPMEVLTGEIEVHVIGDIIYGLKQYIDATNDQDFLDKYGYEMILETAIFWMSRATYNANEDRYDLLHVIGPDEYKEEIDNNAYTNYLAKFNLDWAFTVYELLKQRNNEASINLLTKVSFEKNRVKLMDVREKLYLPEADTVTKLIKQNQIYLDLNEIDLTKYFGKQKGSIHHDYSMNELKQVQVSKQADLVVLFHLFPDLVTKDIVKANYVYYEKHTLHDSTLSLSMHSVVANDIGQTEEAYVKFKEACGLDLGPDMTSSDEGIHSASLGMLWQNIVMGFAGVRGKGHVLTINPNLPLAWENLDFRLVWQGQPLKITMTHQVLEITNSGEELVEFSIGKQSYDIIPKKMERIEYSHEKI